MAGHPDPVGLLVEVDHPEGFPVVAEVLAVEAVAVLGERNRKRL